MSDKNSSRRDFMKTSSAAAAAAATTGAAQAQGTQARGTQVRGTQAPAGVESGTVRAGEWPASRPLKRKVLWNELARSEFPERLENDPVVILPIGSLEQHGPHCPVDMDISIPYHIAVATAEGIDDFPVVVGPPALDRVYALQHGRLRHDHRAARDVHRRPLGCLPQHQGQWIRAHCPHERPWRQRRAGYGRRQQAGPGRYHDAELPLLESCCPRDARLVHRRRARTGPCRRMGDRVADVPQAALGA